MSRSVALPGVEALGIATMCAVGFVGWALLMFRYRPEFGSDADAECPRCRVVGENVVDATYPAGWPRRNPILTCSHCYYRWT